MSRLRKNQNNNDLALLHRRISRHTSKPVLADRRLILPSRGGTSFIKIPRFLQAAGLIAVGAFTALVVHLSYAYIGYDKVVAAKDAAISARDQASLMLRAELDEAKKGSDDAPAARPDHDAWRSCRRRGALLPRRPRRRPVASRSLAARASTRRPVLRGQVQPGRRDPLAAGLARLRLRLRLARGDEPHPRGVRYGEIWGDMGR